ncbi:Hsp20/alpha crystallin family protein (plasmid) [Ensifer adhaerens]|uniref:Hsp20/alpha crystallin family protein n=1 Tax=Ensifer adhaerens TaxID=106592 RepID=UPI001CC030DB|nr:Hsp20/alpha crystallin family protein [Ensifer adhaerens]MBZ7927257.1 Hsp20/alpha crystallin family protein [Ensifer adhaerens]UAX98403.1 Hsp20/alpha crystallin family protein [Ensifer adhaerens]UAY05785.1 Hsp20/alpha crystallin family protein [Ensifer adhaerens]UAY13163.1 Hsp20/alpha crystallin family protein [Ensifer adhaerens]
MQIRDLIPWGNHKGSEITKSEEGSAIFSLQRDVNRLFDDFWKRLDQSFGAFGRWDSGGPRTDVTETDSALEVSVELPGIDQKDVEVSLTDSALTIKGEKKSEQEKSKKGHHLLERSYGSFCRSIPLPSGVDTGKVAARFKDGVLTVTVPKTEEALSRVRKIQVKAT